VADVESLLIVGSGGREFTLIEEALRSGVKNVYSTRGQDAVNYGIENVINIGLGEDIEKIGSFAADEQIDLVLVGPEAPLVKGLGNTLRAKGIFTFGPNKDGAQFEANKAYTHDFNKRKGLPNPDNSETFSPAQSKAAKELIRKYGPDKIYTKRVGLEGGKGAVGYGDDELQKAYEEVDAVAGKNEELLIQGRLFGPEFSAIFMLDGKGNAVATALSRDHKSLYDGGLGPNTGGLGAFSPVSARDAGHMRRDEIEDIGHMIANGLVEDGIDYRGVVYAGLMAETTDVFSKLKVLEYNVRFGDPETQVILQSLGGMAIDYIYAAARGSLQTDMSRLQLGMIDSPVSLTVCLASPGYGHGGDIKVTTGLPVHVPKDLPDDVSIQYAGAKMVNGNPVSSGGRVVYVTKTAATLDQARTVYDYIGRENGGIYLGDDQQVIRTDIGLATKNVI
jgi:phosphoribosylamine--glycine ligase